MLKKLIIIILFALILPLSAYAEFTVEEYRQFEQYPEVKESLNSYVTGVGRGIFWANVMLGFQNTPPLFCIPANLSLDEGIIISLLDQEIRNPMKGARYEADTPIELILTGAFIHRFPCDD